ncbi:MAG TPA: alpha/beta fold hydrolase [Solirubrobacteraceae bacterium]|nr:alpha/beta fold hydrolase [Solirubrobacteraceae bacterium]
MSPFVMLHGFTGHRDDWREVARGLPPGAECLPAEIYGHRGHAESGATLPGFHDEVDRLANVLGQLGLPPVHLVGYSLGARLGLSLLLRHPERVARATLIGVRPGLRSEGEREERRRTDQAWIDLLAAGDIGRFADAWEAQPLFATQADLPAEVVAPVRARRRRHHAAGLASALRALGVAAMPDLWPCLDAIRIPVTLVHGERDATFATLAAQMAALIPGARVVGVPEAGHNPVLERPRAVADILHPERSRP